MTAVPKQVRISQTAEASPLPCRPAPAWPRLAPETYHEPRSAETSPAASPAAAVCWTLTEGAAGMVSQARGLAEAVGYPMVHHRIVLRWPFCLMWPGFVPPWNAVFTDPRLMHPDVPPRLVISCGRQAIVASLALKRRFGPRVFTVHIQDPRMPTRLFDLIVTPAHDELTGANVIHTLGAVHHVTPARLRAAADRGLPAAMSRLRTPFVGIVLGGPNKYYAYHPADIECLIERLQRVVRQHQVSLAIVPSRRTPAAVLERLQAQFGREHYVWTGVGENPYLPILALASHLIVTGDSVSMVSEAAATQKPLYVFHLSERRRARRFRRFHHSFENAGITRPFLGELDHWSYASPDRTGLIATLIHEHLR